MELHCLLSSSTRPATATTPPTSSLGYSFSYCLPSSFSSGYRCIGSSSSSTAGPPWELELHLRMAWISRTIASRRWNGGDADPAGQGGAVQGGSRRGAARDGERDPPWSSSSTASSTSHGNSSSTPGSGRHGSSISTASSHLLSSPREVEIHHRPGPGRQWELEFHNILAGERRPRTTPART